MNADQAPVASTPKSLSERITKQSNKPKPATKVQPKAVTTGKAAATGNKGAKKGRGARRAKPKSSEELDAEMADYFGKENGDAGMSNGGPVQSNNADVGMDDDIVT